MNWFKNLNATPRLMVSFGIMIALSLGMAVTGISNLSTANQRVKSLYKSQVIGILYINAMSSAKLDLATRDRDAFIKADDPVMRAADLVKVKRDDAAMDENLEKAKPLFETEEGKQIIAQMQQTLPVYDRQVQEFIAAIEAHDMAKARLKLYAFAPVAATLGAEMNKARQLKQNIAAQAFHDNDQAFRSARALLIFGCALMTLFGVLLSLMFARTFSKPLGESVEALEKVAHGDLTVALQIHTKDEVGRMASALNHALERLRATLQEVNEGALEVSSSSRQLAAATEAIASGAQEQAASLEETSASLEEITATVRQSADNARQACQLASGSRDEAEKGQAVVANAVSAMAEINVASSKISEIISTIDEIAFQTNLLAVNAAVEAARAGEDGRGFAVVATEVRTLALRSAGAAKEIKTLIRDSLSKVDRGTALVNQSGETLHGIVNSVKRVTDIVSEIAAAAGEQSTGIEQVSTAMTQMDQVTQANSTKTEELSSTADSLAEQSAKLTELVSTFVVSDAQGETHGAPQAAGNFAVARASAQARNKGRFAVRPPSHQRRSPAFVPSAVSLPVPALATVGAHDDSFEEF